MKQTGQATVAKTETASCRWDHLIRSDRVENGEDQLTFSDVTTRLQDMSAEVTQDIPCRKCGHNLRGLHIEGRCPECGTAVGVSLYGPMLRYSSPQWLRRLAMGTVLVVCGVAIIIVPSVVDLIFTFSHKAVIGLIGFIMAGIGSWILTEADPSGLNGDQYGTLRHIVRISLAVVVLDELFNFGRKLMIGSSPSGDMMQRTISTITILVGIAGVFAQVEYFGRLIRRIPNEAMQKRANLLKIVMPVGMLLFVGLVALLLYLGPGPDVTNLSHREFLILFPIFFAAFADFVVLVIFSAMYVRLILRMGMNFRRQALVAEQFWAQQGQAPPQSAH